MRRTIAIAATALAGLLFAVPAQADNPYPGLTHLFNFATGGSGAGAGELFNPAGIAVNDTSGDVYVADSDNNRISQFDADGDFIRAWGEDVVASGPDDRGTGFEVCDVVANPTDVCKAGLSGFASGSFNTPTGVAVDNSAGPAAGSVYVQDNFNLRVQRFTADGQFVLMWGKGVNQTSGGDVCPRPGEPGDACKAGLGTLELSGFNSSDLGAAGGSWQVSGGFTNRVAVDGAGRVYASSGENFNGNPFAPRVVRFDSGGTVLDRVSLTRIQGTTTGDVAVDAAGNAYVNAGNPTSGVLPFAEAEFGLAGEAQFPSVQFDNGRGTSPRSLAVDPASGYLFVYDRSASSPCKVTAAASAKLIEYHPSGQVVDCTSNDRPGLAGLPGQIHGLAVSASHRLYATVGSEIRVFATPVASAPAIGPQSVEPLSRSATVRAPITANLAATDAHVEFGTDGPCSANSCEATLEQPAGASLIPEPQSFQLNDLAPDTTYHYRVVADNGVGAAVEGADRSFHTFPAPVFDPSCPNNLARQQTGAAFLDDCRAYELVSAPDAGGYDVASDLFGAPAPFGGYPGASDKALYAIQDGVVPGVEGNPTNRGSDPYLATRDEESRRWVTRYAGIPADVGSDAPFSSTLLDADAGLSAFAFGGAEICDPCFSDGSSGIPLRAPNGSLIQGMAGSIPVADPTPAGEVRVPLSADGTHFIFASKQQFVPGAHDNGTDVTIYDRNLRTGLTQIVSTNPASGLLANGEDVVALDVSTDGSRILIGNRTRTDAAGNDYFDLYMHVGTSPFSVEVADTPGGVLYAGMTDDGGQVLFTTADRLADDTDTSADLFRATVNGGASSVERVSFDPAAAAGGIGDTDACDPSANSQNPNDWNAIPGGPGDCSAVAIGGGGGVASDSGAAYFLSPERLDTSGATQPSEGRPNLYLARPGEAPVFVTTLESAFDFGSFDLATGVAVDHGNGDVYVLDIANSARVVRKFDETGNPVDFTAGSGAGTNQLGGADAPCTFFFFSPGQGVPTQIAVDQSSGNFYVPNVSFSQIGVFNSAGDCIGTIPVTGPTGVAINPTDQNVYVTTGTGGSSMVRVFTPAGAAVTSFSVAANSPSPKGLAVDSAGRVYVVNNTQAAVYGASGTFTGVLDQNPSFGVAVDGADNVFVNEGGRIARFNSAGASLGSFGEGTLSGSVGIAVGADGGVYASNEAGDAVARFNPGLTPKLARDSELVVDSVTEAKTRHTEQFQTTPSGEHAAFASSLPLSGFDSADRFEVFRYDAGGQQLDCASCKPTGLSPSSDSSLPANGLGLSDDGRVFFNTAERLVLRDTNARQDAYQWDGQPELISSGQGNSDSALLSISADGTDAFFFTRETLAEGDLNGNHVKLYTARENGGFFKVPDPPPCVASDECHGAGSQAAARPPIGTIAGSGGNVSEPGPSCSSSRARALAAKTRAASKRAKALRRQAAQTANRRAARRLRARAQRLARTARRNAAAAKRCRARLAAGRSGR